MGDRVFRQHDGEPMRDPQDIAAMQILEARLETMAKDLTEMKDDIKSITSGMERVIRLEEGRVQHEQSLARAFTTINNHDARLLTIENEMPMMKMIRGWVIAGVIGVVCMFGMQLFSMAFLIDSNSMRNYSAEVQRGNR